MVHAAVDTSNPASRRQGKTGQITMASNELYQAVNEHMHGFPRTQTRFGVGKPRCLQGRAAAIGVTLIVFLHALRALWRQVRPALRLAPVTPVEVAHVPA